VPAAIIGLVVGVLGNNVDAFGASYDSVAFLMPRIFDSSAFPYEVGNIGLTVFYLAGLALLYTRVRGAPRILAPFGWAGWLALSNYLAQSILFNLVLPPRFATLPMLFVFFALQVVCSGLWLKWFRFGPVEWVWRSLTWWRAQPMRRSV
jgi:uncharacterized protein